MISKLLVSTDGCRFCNIKETDNNHSRWQSFQFRFNSSAKIVCNQLNFNRKFFVFSRILADFFSLRDNSANPNISQIFPSHPYFFQISDWGSRRSDVMSRGIVHRNMSRGAMYGSRLSHVHIGPTECSVLRIPTD